MLGFDESEKLRDLEERLLPRLELMRQQVERIPPGQRGLVEQWTRRLKSAFYDAEDILDVADYHRLEKQVMSQSGTKLAINRVKQITSGKNRKLKKALKKLEDIVEGSQLLTPLTSTITSGTSSNDISDPANSVTRITTTSSPTGFMIGRDKERDETIRMLHETTSVSEPTSSSKCYSVIGVYGIAGSGKTTLAQHVCTYERRENYFNPIMWIHVNQTFSVHGIYRQMLEAALGEPCQEFSNIDTLQMKLEAALRSKRFLLVLDDVWTGKDVNDEYRLDQLCSPLMAGDTGSKVLVTTRFAHAAKYLGCHSPMQIPELNEMDFFDLFMRYALHGANLGDQELETFRIIGRRIAKKLKRSPLAARVVGARLCKQLQPIIWRRVEDHGLLTDTMGALWWSYQYLDEHVRRCFAYCSIFSQGHMFKRAELVDLWMAEGFIKSTGTVERRATLMSWCHVHFCRQENTQVASVLMSDNAKPMNHENLPEPARTVGGVRKQSLRKVETKPEEESQTAVTSTQNALNPTATAEQLLMEGAMGVGRTPAVRDAAEQPKANASTYYPPEPKHQKHESQATRGSAVRATGGVQQPERFNH